MNFQKNTSKNTKGKQRKRTEYLKRLFNGYRSLHDAFNNMLNTPPTSTQLRRFTNLRKRWDRRTRFSHLTTLEPILGASTRRVDGLVKDNLILLTSFSGMTLTLLSSFWFNFRFRVLGFLSVYCNSTSASSSNNLESTLMLNLLLLLLRLSQVQNQLTKKKNLGKFNII